MGQCCTRHKSRFLGSEHQFAPQLFVGSKSRDAWRRSDNQRRVRATRCQNSIQYFKELVHTRVIITHSSYFISFEKGQSFGCTFVTQHMCYMKNQFIYTQPQAHEQSPKRENKGNNVVLYQHNRYATRWIQAMQGGIEATDWSNASVSMLKTAPTIKHYAAYDVECTCYSTR